MRGHFPDYPVMPGVLIVEALAQAPGEFGFFEFDSGDGNALNEIPLVDVVLSSGAHQRLASRETGGSRKEIGGMRLT